MIRIHKIFATSLGIGYIGKGGGTVAAAVAALCWYLALAGSAFAGLWPLVFTVAITVLGIWSGNEVEPYWGKDDKKVVIDEVAGMCVSLLFLPVNYWYVLAGLVLFRFFDIVKPLGIRRTEQLNGGLGVMMDDVVAGIYTNLLLQIAYHSNLFGG
ncbi:phosphatidylglycerophosphatase A family protein [Chitinophaga pinensis]|uniref:Phosphatidylglycerophosphatase A n=1 Tax=Chitinophaga pinensis (strain ATCC 43595 / DSM 2588 / LMG 13176 / NBRC 15968 / NCIMB 11800 / UQM 2034) TaxID=485918 RepID=A0A979G2T6_CHIPD|nr:phosphatidylglycerophosphatase A [Chitinophaga pinensis]ACU59892.1 phosphatidylglycerophosphatase A [Chitinophaga pinensis DSM 2588]